MKRIFALVLAAALVGLPAFLRASPLGGDEKETDRLENAGQVAKEIMDIPDDIRRTCWTKRTASLWCHRCSKRPSSWALATAAAP
jgi:hypothetical protein